MDKQTILSYEAMAKLRLTDENREWAVNAMTTLEDSFSALSQIDTGDTPPLVSVLELQNVLRDDIPKKIVSRDDLLSGAPEEYNGYFQVPKTLE